MNCPLVLVLICLAVYVGGGAQIVPLRERDMGEGDCCGGRACQHMPPPLDQDLHEHTQKEGEKDRVSPPRLSFCVISEGQRNYWWRGGGSCDIAAAATLNVSLDEKGLCCVCVYVLLC